MPCQLICERLRMIELDDRSILQLKHLVGSNLSRAHDLFSVQNVSISRLCMFRCHAMCRATNEHLAHLD
jgi:ribosomal protein S13